MTMFQSKTKGFPAFKNTITGILEARRSSGVFPRFSRKSGRTPFRGFRKINSETTGFTAGRTPSSSDQIIPKNKKKRNIPFPDETKHCVGLCMERVMGIEPTTTAWEAVVLPLNYTRMMICSPVPAGTFLVIHHGKQILSFPRQNKIYHVYKISSRFHEKFYFATKTDAALALLL